MRRSGFRGDSELPSYLAGTLLLRGRIRFLFSAVLISGYLLVGPRVLDTLGYTTNVVIGPVVLLLAWMWGSRVGVAAALVGVSLNSYWAIEAGAVGFASGPRLVEATVISLTALVIGQIGQILERALGARYAADRAYSALEEAARDRMLSITDQVPVGLYRSTPEGRISGGNDALMRILGFEDRKAMLKTNARDHYVRPEDRDRQLGSDTGDDEAWREFELRKADGSVIWVRDWARAVRDESGNLLYFDGVLEDITEQRVVAERFRAAFEDSPIGMTISGVDGRMIKGNAAVADLLGRPLEELEGIHFSEYSFDDEMETTRAALAALAAGEVVRYEKRLLRPDGSVVWALISLAPIEDGSDEPDFISHVVDVTDRRRAQEALENLVRSKDELIASVSHELRTPLTVVQGLAQELDSSWLTFTVPEQKEFIGLIAQQSGEVAHIVEDLLVAARADIGKLPIYGKSIDLLDEVNNSLATVPDLNVTVSRVGKATPTAFADGTRVRQILRNLLSNAQRYGGENVSVRCGVTAGMAWAEVADDGAGIPNAEVTKVFEPYQRAHNADGQPLSVGLGLTVSLRLAELMGGALSYRYEAGQAIFRLALPEAGTVHAKPAAGVSKAAAALAADT